MRLIDADELFKEAECKNNDGRCRAFKCEECPDYAVSVKDIDRIPIVDTERHGHWKRRNMDIVEHPLHCTRCGWSNYHIDRYVESFKFCPECGAPMDEEVTE